MSDCRVTIIRASGFESIRDGIEEMKNALHLFSANGNQHQPEIDSFLFLDLSGFNIISSQLIGLFCSLIVDKRISVLALCGLQPSVQDILKRYKMISTKQATDENSSTNTNTQLQGELGKIVTFSTVEEGLASLIPV